MVKHKAQAVRIHDFRSDEDLKGANNIVELIHITDGDNPNAEHPACSMVTEDGEQCQYNSGHLDECSFDELCTMLEDELVFTVLKERDPKGLPLVIDSLSFSGLTAEFEVDE